MCLVPGKAREMAHAHAFPPMVPGRPSESPTITLEEGFPRKVGCKVAVGVKWGAGVPAAWPPWWGAWG